MSGGMSMVKNLLFVLISLALPLAAADISGKWSGTIEIADTGNGPIQTTVRAEFEQKSGAVSGKMGRPGDDESPIRNGKVEGEAVSFEVSSPETTRPVRFTLRLVGDRLEGEMKGEIDEGEIVGKVTLSREKAGVASR
jgi:hypothetical protein